MAAEAAQDGIYVIRTSLPKERMSASDAVRKVATHSLGDGTPAHSFRTMFEELGGIVRNVCRRAGAESSEPTFLMTTTPNPPPTS